MKKNQIWKFIILGVLLACLPLLAKMGLMKTSFITVFGFTCIYAIAALGFNLLLGWSGLISLGTAGFIGLGGYLSAYFVENLHLPFELSLILSVAVATIIGLLIGIASLKIEGQYLAIATLAVSEILRKTFEELEPFTGGFSGKSAQYPTLLGFLKLNRTTTYIFIVFVLVVVMILVHNLVKGQMGRGLNAMRGSEHAAQAMGVNLLRYRLLAFAFATALAALSGVLYVHFNKYIYPMNWHLMLSLNFMAVVVVGGFRSIFGTLLGTLIVFAIPDILLKQITIFQDLSYVINGIMIILVVMFYPHGLIRLFDSLGNWMKKGKEKTS